MSDYLSKYQGEEIDERLERVDYLIPKSAITSDFADATHTQVPSSFLTNNLKSLVDQLYQRFVNNDLDQTIEGQKTFQGLATFSGGVVVPSGQSVILITDTGDARGAVSKAYMDKRAVDTNVAGRGLKFLAGAGVAPNSIEIELDTNSGLRFNDATVNAKLRVDINGTSEAGFANPSDELLMWSLSAGALRKIKKSALLGDLTKSLRIRGTWNPATNTVSGDPLNTSLSKTNPPMAADGDSPQGFQYIASADGSFDLVSDSTPEQFRIGDSVVWTGTSWVLMRDQSKVVAFTGAQGTQRQGLVTAAYGDYTGSMVPYNRAGGGRIDVKQGTTDVEQAINDLDDAKVGRTSPGFLGTPLFQNGTKLSLSWAWAGQPDSGVYYDGNGAAHVNKGEEIISVLSSGLQTYTGKKLSLAGKGWVWDNGSNLETVCIGEVWTRAGITRIKSWVGQDIIVAGAGGVALRNANVDVLVVNNTNIQALKPVNLPLGTASAPSLFFNGYSTTGFWNPDGDVICASVSGTEKFRVNSTGVLITSSLNMGTDAASAKRIGFVADPVGPLDATNYRTMQASTDSTYAADLNVTGIATSTACATFDMTLNHGAKYVVVVKNIANGQRQMVELMVTHDGSNVYVTEYGQVGFDLATFTFVVSGNNVLMNVAPVSGSIDVRIKTVALI